jgi:hypothetical protein
VSEVRRNTSIAEAALFLHFAATLMKVANVLAAWLIVLILLPFTAPFSTYEVSNQLKDSRHGSPFVPHTDPRVGSDTALALVPARLTRRSGKPTRIARPHHHSTRTLTSGHVTRSADSVPSHIDLQALHTVLRL